MKFAYSRRFQAERARLPKSAREQFLKQKTLFGKNPRHPSLHFKKLKDMHDTYSIRVAGSYRALFIFHHDTAIFFAIGHRKNVYRKNR